MDKVLKSRLSAQTKAKDKQLARTQALLLDAVGPLSFILEEARKGQLPPKATVEAAQTALRLLVNVSANISRERRRAAIANMNYRLVDMAEDDQLFAKAAPILFGDGFANKAKERDEELKCLNHASLQGRDHRKTGLDDRKFFQTSPSPFSPRGAAPTTPGAEDEEAELSTATTLTKYRVPQGMNRRRTNGEEEENRTLKYSIK